MLFKFANQGIARKHCLNASCIRKYWDEHDIECKLIQMCLSTSCIKFRGLSFPETFRSWLGTPRKQPPAGSSGNFAASGKNSQRWWLLSDVRLLESVLQQVKQDSVSFRSLAFINSSEQRQPDPPFSSRWWTKKVCHRQVNQAKIEVNQRFLEKMTFFLCVLKQNQPPKLFWKITFALKVPRIWISCWSRRTTKKAAFELFFTFKANFNPH